MMKTQKLLDRLSCFSSIHPFTALKLLFYPLWNGIIIPNSCLKIEILLPTLCLNVALNSGVPCQYGVDHHWKWGVGNTTDKWSTEWCNTFGLDCRSYLSLHWGMLEDLFCLDDAQQGYCQPIIIHQIKCYNLIGLYAGFFSKFLTGGGDSKFSVPVGPRRGRSRMGGDLRKKSDWNQNCPLNAKLGHFLLFQAWNTAF